MKRNTKKTIKSIIIAVAVLVVIILICAWRIQVKAVEKYNEGVRHTEEYCWEFLDDSEKLLNSSEISLEDYRTAYDGFCNGLKEWNRIFYDMAKIGKLPYSTLDNTDLTGSVFYIYEDTEELYKAVIDFTSGGNSLDKSKDEIVQLCTNIREKLTDILVYMWVEEYYLGWLILRVILWLATKEVQVMELLGEENSTSEQVIKEIAEASAKEKERIANEIIKRGWITAILGLLMAATMMYLFWVITNNAIFGLPRIASGGMLGFAGCISGNGIYYIIKGKRLEV